MFVSSETISVSLLSAFKVITAVEIVILANSTTLEFNICEIFSDITLEFD